MMIKCKHCGKEYSSKGIGTHIWRTHGEGKNFNSNNDYTKRKIWNKGLNKNNNESIRKTGETYSNRIKNKEIEPYWKGKHLKPSMIQKLKINGGGLRVGSGRGKKGLYKGYWCDSSWELAWIIYNLENGIKFERNTKGFDYQFKNETRKYFPDFIVGDCYIEIKGWLDEKNVEKIQQFKGKLKVLTKKEMKLILEYVENKYGKNFTNKYGELAE